MLLPSCRHRDPDLDLWADLETADRLWYVTGRVEDKAARAIRVMAEFGRPAYVSISWGKDSTVIAHLLWRSGLGLPAGNVAQVGPGGDPYVAAVRDNFLARFPVDYHEESVTLEAIPDDGGHSPALDVGIGRLRARFGTDRYVGGVRAAESGIRRVGMRARGLATARTCQPIGWWSVQDVFAYLAAWDLPVHPNYAMLGGGRWDRGQIRVSTIGGPKGDQFGRAEWEREYYGEIVRRMVCRPEPSLRPED